MIVVLLDGTGHSPPNALYPANDGDAATNCPLDHKKSLASFGA
jgi:hypothetical protein